MSDPFIAEIRMFAGNFAPRGWAMCYGQLLPIEQNTALFSLIGTTYGGDGRTTTALPNMEGRAPMHPGRGPGLTGRWLGEKIGTEMVTLAESQMPEHSHNLTGVNENADNKNSGGNLPGPTKSLADTVRGNLYSPDTNNSVELAPETLSSVGGGQAHNNMQPYLVLNFIIALTGVYPPRN